MAAALATIEQLEHIDFYSRLYALGEKVRQGITEVLEELGIEGFVAGFGSVFVVYFMNPPANSYTDLLRNNKALDEAFRRDLIESGILVHPSPLKRSHISAAHSEQDIDRTVGAIRKSLEKLVRLPKGKKV